MFLNFTIYNSNYSFILYSIIFPLTKTTHHYKSKPLGMLGFLIGHEGYGSLLSLLKKKDLN